MLKNTKHYTDTINYELEKTARVMRILGIQLFEKLQISLSVDEYVALDTISCHTEICQRDLAKLIVKDRSNTGKILNQLEAKGLITRFVDTKNNRLVRKMSATKEGSDMLSDIDDKIEDYISETKRIVTEEEIEVLYKSLKRLREKFESAIDLKI